MDTLSCCLHPESSDVAIIITGKQETTISHAEVHKSVGQIRECLRQGGLQGGQRVAMILPNPHHFTLAFLAVTLQACIAAPLNQNLKEPEFCLFFADFKPDLVLLARDDVVKSSPATMAAKAAGIPFATVSTEGVSVVVELPKTQFRSEEVVLSASTIALVLHTSGTTGKPKAVPLTHGNLSTSVANIRKHYHFTAEDRTSVIMPLFHIHGIVCALLTPLAVGAAVLFSGTASGLTPSFLRDAVTHKVTWYTATPTLHRLVLKLPGPVPSLRFIRSCSSPLDATLLGQIEKRFECVVVEAYAMTEAAHQVCSNPVSSDRREGSVGVPTGVDVKIIGEDGATVNDGHVGELCVKGPNIMSGYMENEEANRNSFVDSWFRTGDVGKLESGYLVLTGRIKELINKGGEKIGPVEIDAVVNQHPDVAEAVTFGIPDQMYGEEVAMAVVLTKDKDVTEKDIKTWLGERLASHKVPKKVYFVDSIPKTAVGKLQRSLVAQKMLENDRT